MNRRQGLRLGIALAVLAGLVGIPSCARNAAPSRPAIAQRTVELLQARHPERRFELSADGAVIRSKDLQLGMENLYRRAEVEALSGADLDHAIEESFAGAFAQLGEGGRRLPWPEAQERLRVQLAPRDYLKSVPNLVYREALPELVELLAIDSEKTYTFVSQDDLKLWRVSAEEVETRASRNLAAASTGIVPAAVPSGDPSHKGAYLAFDVQDGYAAARILLPGVRKAIAERLGEPFYFAVPNRDFLVAWSSDYAYADRFAEKARRDFAEYDHSLSPEVFVGDSNGVRPGRTSQ